MKELLDIMDKFRTGSAPPIGAFVVVAAIYAAYCAWKHYFCEAARLDMEKRRLEVQKLKLEVIHLSRNAPAQVTDSRKRSPSGELSIAREKAGIKVSKRRSRLFAFAFGSRVAVFLLCRLPRV